VAEGFAPINLLFPGRIFLGIAGHEGIRKEASACAFLIA
jgi:hypothetical protein